MGQGTPKSWLPLQKFSFFPFHGVFYGLKLHVTSRESCTLTGVGSEINLTINIILLIIYLPWVFLKYQTMPCKHHSYLDRLSHTLPPPLSRSPQSCEAAGARGCSPSLLPQVPGTGQLWSREAGAELLGVTQKRNDATRSKKLMKW